MKTYYGSFNLLKEGQTLEKLGFWAPLAKGILNVAKRAKTWETLGEHTLRGGLGRALSSTGAQTAVGSIESGLQTGSKDAIKGAVKEFWNKSTSKMYNWSDPLHNSNLKDANMWDTSVTGAPKHRPALSPFTKDNAVARLKGSEVQGWQRPNMFKSMAGDTVKTFKDLGANGTYGKNLWNMLVNNWTNSQHYMDAQGFLRKRSLAGKVISGSMSAPGVLGTAALTGGFDNPKESLRNLGFSAVTLGGAGIGQLGMAIS